MVKITNPVNSEIGTPNETLGYLNVKFSPDSYGAQLGAAISHLGNSLQAQNEKDQRLDALSKFSNFETQSKLNLQKMQEQTPINDGNFFDRAMADYDNASEQFLNDIPPALQKEFEFRTNQLKESIAGSAYNFAFKQKGLYYNQQISDALTNAGNALTQNPNDLDNQKKIVDDFISATGLPEIDKEKQRRLAEANLAAIVYRSKMQGVRTQELNTPAPSDAATILQHEEGFRPTPYWDTNHYRIGYGSDTITKADGTVVEVKPGMTITKEDAQRDLDRRVGLLTQSISQEVGGDVWNALPDATKAALISVSYNYGHLPGHVRDAVKTGDQEQIASAVEGLSANKDRRAREAAIIRSGNAFNAKRQEINNDPAFAMLSPDDRESLARDGERQANSAWADQVRAHKAQVDAQLNDLYVGLLDGTKGQTDIDNLRRKGTLIDYEDIAKAQNILKERDSKLNAFNYGENKLLNGGIWDKTDENDKKGANALFGDEGKQAIENQDADYVQKTLLPRYAKMEMAAPDMASLLLAQTKLNDPKAAAFAFETLRQMREQAPQAFNAQFPEDVQKQIDQWGVRRNFYSPEELVNEIQGRGIDPAQRQAQELLRKEIKTQIIDPSSQNFIGLKDAASSYNSFFHTDPALPLAPTAQTEFLNDYRALVEDNYVKSGDLSIAKKLADQAIHRVWAPSSIGGTYRIMKFPPEVAGYQTLNGSFDWIDKSVRTQFPQIGDKNFELLADDTTEQEIMDHRAQAVDPHFQRTPTLPSYLVQYQDDNGLYRLAGDTTGKVMRVDFTPDLADVKAAENAYRAKQEQADYKYIQGRYYAAKVIENAGGAKVPPALEAEYNRLTNQQIEQSTTNYQSAVKNIFGPIADRLKEANQ